MKRAVIWLGLAALIAVGIDALGDLTQNRPDVPRQGTRSEILLEVRNRNFRATSLEAAQNLWAVCSGTVHNRLAPPGLVAVSEDRFLLATEPAVEKYGWRRLKGCLEDLTLDQVIAKVVSKQDLPALQP